MLSARACMVGISEVARIRVLVQVKVVRVFFVGVIVVLRRLGARCIGVVHQVPAAEPNRGGPFSFFCFVLTKNAGIPKLSRPLFRYYYISGSYFL